MMNFFIELCESSGGGSDDNRNTNVDDLLLENRLLCELFQLIDQHQKHLGSDKEKDMCTKNKKAAIVNEIKGIFSIINSCTTRTSGKNIVLPIFFMM